MFENPIANKWIAILADLPNAFPTAMGFRCYHMKHHSHLGDYDLRRRPARAIWEAEIVGNRWSARPSGCSSSPSCSSTRLDRLKGTVPIRGKWTYINIAVIAVFDLLMLYSFGANALLYLFASFWFSVGGLHPLSARWIQEHFAFDPTRALSIITGR